MYDLVFIGVQNDNKIVLMGFHRFPFQLSVVRFNSNGIPDSTFGVNGVFTNPSDLFANDHDFT